MERILKALREEIKKLSEEENLNTTKLYDLCSTYQKLSGYQTQSVAQMVPIALPQQGYQNFGIGQNPPRNEISMFVDIMKDTLLRQNKKVATIGSKDKIRDYIWWYRFIDEKESKKEGQVSQLEMMNKSVDIRKELYKKILNMIETELNKEEIKEENKEENNEDIKNEIHE